MLKTDPDVLKGNYEHQGFVVVNELFDEIEVAEFRWTTRRVGGTVKKPPEI